jgi:hypothetical protein
MAKAQEELASTLVVGTAGGDAVRVEMTCDYNVKSVKIAPEAIDPNDAETLEDLVTVAFNAAVAAAGETSSKRMGALTGGMRIPGLG